MIQWMTIAPEHVDACPHCSVRQRFDYVRTPAHSGHARWDRLQLRAAGKNSPQPDGASERLLLRGASCTNCQRIALWVDAGDTRVMLWPRAPAAKAPSEVSDESPDLAMLFREAVEVLQPSPRASAALARRCLDEVLTDKLGAPFGTLESKIDHARASLPVALAEVLDKVREIGNYAVHRKKSEASGEIVAVEPGEAQWTLQVVLQLFEHCYVRPSRERQWRAAMDAKLADARRDS